MSVATETQQSRPAYFSELYVRNLAPLWRFDPSLAIEIEAVPESKLLPVVSARSGAWTAAMTSSDGKSVQLHSRYDPVKEAQSLVDAVPIDEKYCFIICGCGLGYHVAALRQRLTGDAIIIVVESSIETLATAMRCTDMTDALRDGRLVFLTRPDKAHLHERLQPHTALMMLGARFVSHPPSERLAPALFRQMRGLITDFVAYSRISVLTLLQNAEITCRNIAYNLPTYVSTPPINVLRDRFRSNPAIIVSAGPSLRRNIDTLANARGRAVICAVQTALKPLLDRGIVPDFVTSLDYHEVSRHFFENVEGLDRVHLIAEPKASWHVVDNYDGPIGLLDNAFARLLIGDELAGRDGLPAGATVAHLAFYLAEYLGCDPIIFVGQDLAYTHHVYYLPGVEMHRTWRSEMNRFCTIETKEWERIARSRPILRKVAANDGGELYTDDLLFTYLEQFEKDIIQCRARVINATEGGARIRGTTVMSLAEALARHCATPIPPERFMRSSSADESVDVRRKAAREQICKRIDEVERMDDLCERMLGVLERLQMLTDDPAAFNRTIVKVDELRAKVNASQRAYRVINAVSQLAELRRFSADRRLVSSAATGVDRARQQLHRDIQYVSALKTGAAKALGILRETARRFDSSPRATQATAERASTS